MSLLRTDQTQNDKASALARLPAEFDHIGSLLKSYHEAIEKLGWSVVIIPYFDWEELIKDSARKKYLKRKLGLLTKQLSEENASKAATLYKNNEKSDINIPSIDDERKLVKLFNKKRPKTSLTLNDKEDNQYHKSSHQMTTARP